MCSADARLCLCLSLCVCVCVWRVCVRVRVRVRVRVSVRPDDETPRHEGLLGANKYQLRFRTSL